MIPYRIQYTDEAQYVYNYPKMDRDVVTQGIYTDIQSAGMGVFAPAAHRTHLRPKRCLSDLNLTDGANHGVDFVLVFDWRVVRASNHHRHCRLSDRIAT
jgi:hypothetical protein